MKVNIKCNISGNVTFATNTDYFNVKDAEYKKWVIGQFNKRYNYFFSGEQFKIDSIEIIRDDN